MSNKRRKNRLYEKCIVSNAQLKQSNTYKKLVQNNCIVVFSDETCDAKANKLSIEYTDEKIALNFQKNANDPSFGLSVRISNSGSKISPFNSCFMGLFNQLQALDKTNINNKIQTL